MDKIDMQLEALVAKNVSKISVGSQKVFMTCLNSFTFGCNWGFLKSTTQDFKQSIEMLKGEKNNITLNKVSNGVIISCSERYLMNILNTIFEGKCPIQYQQLAERRKSELGVFQKWLTKLTNSTSGLDYVSRKTVNGRTVNTVTFALYGVNDSHAIRVNGIDYPAFKMTVPEALNVMLSKPEFANMGVAIRTLNADKSAYVESFITAKQLYGNENAVKAFFNATTISEANTGLFVKIIV